MSSDVGTSRWGEQVWSVATISSVVVVQFVLGALIITWRLLGAHSFPERDAVEDFRTALLTASGIVLIIALLVGGVLVSRRSPVPRGFGLSVVASGVVTSIMGVAYVFWIY
ncbi:hypothetical protein DVS77_28875 [Mycolicibacterium moriokaense]|nr:hypothetical protein DVS77_28875 [Mycolicibacterium moriokaense]